MKRVRREVEGCAQPLDWSYGIYHKGAGEEDKTCGGTRSADEKGAAIIAGPPEAPPVTATFTRSVACTDQFLVNSQSVLATSGFGLLPHRIGDAVPHPAWS
jgi:hypothetical protein